MERQLIRLTLQTLFIRGTSHNAQAKRMQHYLTLLNSTSLDDVGLRGRTNATRCAEQTRTVKIRNNDPEFYANLSVALVWERTCCVCANATTLKCATKRVQLYWSHMRTKEMLNEVASNVWWKSNFVQHHKILCKMMQHRGQRSSTCCIQQCWIAMSHSFGQGFTARISFKSQLLDHLIGDSRRLNYNHYNRMETNLKNWKVVK